MPCPQVPCQMPLRMRFGSWSTLLPEGSRRFSWDVDYLQGFSQWFMPFRYDYKSGLMEMIKLFRTWESGVIFFPISLATKNWSILENKSLFINSINFFLLMKILCLFVWASLWLICNDLDVATRENSQNRPGKLWRCAKIRVQRSEVRDQKGKPIL